MFMSGDLVIRKWSKAGTLRGKLYKVIDRVNSSSISWDVRYRLITPSGRQVEVSGWRLEKLSDAITQAEENVKLAREVVMNKETELIKLKNESRTAANFFPKI